MSDSYSELAEFFKEKAAKGYVQDGSNSVATFDDVRLEKSLGDFAEIFQYIPHLSKLTSKDIRRASEVLSDKGFKGFAGLTQTSTSALLHTNGSNVLRVGRSPKLSEKYSRADFPRSFCPLVLQPVCKLHFERATVGFEVLPAQVMLKNRDIPHSFKSLLAAILKGTCFSKHLERKDLGVMPDGTPIYVDPDAIYQRAKPTQEDYHRIRKNCEELGLPELLSWVLPDGRFKQDLFYPGRISPEDVMVFP